MKCLYTRILLQKFTKIRKKAKKRFDKKTKKNKLHLSNGTETPTGKTNTPQDNKIFYTFIIAKFKKMVSQIEWEIAPSEEIFQEIKVKSCYIWQQYDNTYWYVTEKVEYIDSLKNIGSNAMTIVSMFDTKNQAKLLRILSDEAVKFLFPRMTKWDYFL